MKKFLLTILFCFVVVSSTQSSYGAGITAKNGVTCVKFGMVKKVGSKTYRCAKNPYVKPTQNTWTLRSCLTAYAMWKDAKEQYADWIDLAKLAGAEGQRTMDELQASITSLEGTMKDVACKRGA